MIYLRYVLWFPNNIIIHLLYFDKLYLIISFIFLFFIRNKFGSLISCLIIFVTFAP